ncbi:MAG: type II secretion system protein GspG [Pyrinomonadaceae bacterium]
MRTPYFFRFSFLAVLVLVSIDAKADLSAKQARKLISRMAGLELPNSAVRVKRIFARDTSLTGATAEIQGVFRLEKDEQGRWRVAEMRAGESQWEPLDFVPGVERLTELTGACAGPNLSTKAGTDPSPKRARCLIAGLLYLESPSDAVRIKSVSPGLSLARPTALVEALIELDFQFARNGKGDWSITGVRAGSDWINPEKVLSLANAWKGERALYELKSMANALETFRRERLFYVESDSHTVLIDHLNPQFLPHVIRVDPWKRPYLYRGERDHFTLRSAGPDGKEGTPDDLVVTNSSQ